MGLLRNSMHNFHGKILLFPPFLPFFSYILFCFIWEEMCEIGRHYVETWCERHKDITSKNVEKERKKKNFVVVVVESD